MGISPPSFLPSAGLEKSWPGFTNARCKLPGEVLLLAPSDPHFDAGLSRLVDILTDAGIDQIVAPTDLANSAARLMISSATRLGFVMSEKEWSGGARLAGVPSAVLLPEEDTIAELILRQVIHFGRDGGATTIVVARPERLIFGRRLDQTISRHAPYSEDLLRSMAVDGITHK